MALGVEQLVTPSNGTVPKSVEDRIRAEHKKAQGKSRLDLEVPGYEFGEPQSTLGVRYRPLDPEDLERLEASVKDVNVKTRITLSIDALIAACECILIRGEDGVFRPLLVEGEPVAYEDRLASWFGEEFDTAREIVLTVFSKLPAAYVGAMQHREEIEKWMNGEEHAGQEQLLGES